MIDVSRPSLAAFLAAPIDQVARVAPATVICTLGGTRRDAVLAGLSPQSDAYAGWTRERMVALADRLFHLGVRHLFINLLRPYQLAEVGRYRERLIDWLDWGLAGPEALADYRRLGWRTRLLGAQSLPELLPAAERLRAAAPGITTPTLWFYIMPEPDASLQWLLAATRTTPVCTRVEAIRAIYGEDIPLATLFLGFGKPIFAPDLMPPLLEGNMQCYWVQRPGYGIGERMLRRIIYDYAYTRPTWVPDKSARYDEVPAQRNLWEQPLVLGLGQRVGTFWYPALHEIPVGFEGEDL